MSSSPEKRIATTISKAKVKALKKEDNASGFGSNVGHGSKQNSSLPK
jgi:hypothetical protein